MTLPLLRSCCPPPTQKCALHTCVPLASFVLHHPYDGKNANSRADRWRWPRPDLIASPPPLEQDYALPGPHLSIHSRCRPQSLALGSPSLLYALTPPGAPADLQTKDLAAATPSYRLPARPAATQKTPRPLRGVRRGPTQRAVGHSVLAWLQARAPLPHAACAVARPCMPLVRPSAPTGPSRAPPPSLQGRRAPRPRRALPAPRAAELPPAGGQPATRR